MSRLGTWVSKKVRVVRDYVPQYADPVQLECGQHVTVGVEDEKFRGWKWCRASDGREGWVPVEITSAEGSKGVMLESYSAVELSVISGEIVTVELERHDWLLVRSRDKKGWIPASHAKALE
jgi:SH3-like domain-containing protein